MFHCVYGSRTFDYFDFMHGNLVGFFLVNVKQTSILLPRWLFALLPISLET